MRFILFCIALVVSTLATSDFAHATGGGVGPLRASAVRFGQNRSAVRQIRAAELNARAFQVQKLQAANQFHHVQRVQRVQAVRVVQPVYVQPLHVQRVVVPQQFYVRPQAVVVPSVYSVRQPLIVY